MGFNAGGAASGAASGAAMGSVVPGLGTFAGAALGGIAGGFTGGSDGSKFGYDFEDAWRWRHLNESKKAVQTRVHDAIKAGVHPLFAMGVQPYSGSGGSVVPGQGDSGSNAGAALNAVADVMMQRHSASADKDAAIAAYYRSLVKRGEQAANVTQDYPAVTIPLSEGRSMRPRPLPPEPKIGKTPGGDYWVTGPSMTAEQMQQEYGEAAELLYGAYRWIQDYWRYNKQRDWERNRRRYPQGMR